MIPFPCREWVGDFLRRAGDTRLDRDIPRDLGHGGRMRVAQVGPRGDGPGCELSLLHLGRRRGRHRRVAPAPGGVSLGAPSWRRAVSTWPAPPRPCAPATRELAQRREKLCRRGPRRELPRGGKLCIPWKPQDSWLGHKTYSEPPSPIVAQDTGQETGCRAGGSFEVLATIYHHVVGPTAA